MELHTNLIRVKGGIRAISESKGRIACISEETVAFAELKIITTVNTFTTKARRLNLALKLNYEEDEPSDETDTEENCLCRLISLLPGVATALAVPAAPLFGTQNSTQ